MDALTAKVKDALLAEGACPATAEMLATRFVEASRKRIARERRENDAQRLLHLGPEVVAARLRVHPNYVYELAEKGRRKFSGFSEQMLKETREPEITETG